MRESTIKDKILKALINKECKADNESIGKHLSIPAFTAYTLLKEMKSAGHVETIETASKNVIAACIVRQVYPQGEHFYNKTSYRKQAIKDWWRNAPKNYWMIGTVFALISTNAALIVELLSKGKSAGQQSEQPKVDSIESTKPIPLDSTKPSAK